MLTKKNLHQYQKDIANFIINNPKAFIIAEMGLGKTVSTLMPLQWMQQNKGLGPVLVLAPLRVALTSWPDEIANWKDINGTGYHIIHGKGKIQCLPRVPMCFSNYESLPFIIDKGLHRQFDTLVLDESSMVKSHKTKRFKMLKKIQKSFKRVILLTGTPSPSGNLTELWSQVFMLDGGKRLGTSFWGFQRKYYDSDFMGYNWTLKPGAKQEIEKKISDLTITLKAKDYLKLPPVIHTTIPVTMPVKSETLYREMEKDFLIQVDDGFITAANAAVMGGKLRQITAGGIYDEDKNYKLLHQAKIDALQEIIEGTSSNILCAFQFKFERSFLERRFPDARFIDGSTKGNESVRTIAAWNKGKIKLLCCHPQSVGHGLNLQAGGNVLVWLSPDWSLERTLQMNARIYRQGQDKKVFIYTIAAKNTIDHVVISALQDKGAGQESTINALKEYAARRLNR